MLYRILIGITLVQWYLTFISSSVKLKVMAMLNKLFVLKPYTLNTTRKARRYKLSFSSFSCIY